MTDKQPIQADGDARKGAPDGVNQPAGEGESQGGAYPSPPSKQGRFDGGQSHKGYEGPENPNATTKAK